MEAFLEETTKRLKELSSSVSELENFVFKKDAQPSSSSSTASDAEVAKLKHERDEALAKVSALKKQQEQDEYRIKILIHALEDAEKKCNNTH